MTDRERGDLFPDSGEPREAPEENDEGESSATDGSRSDAEVSSRRRFLQAGGLAIGMSALGEAKARDGQQSDVRRQGEPAMTESNRQDSSLRTTTQVSLSIGKRVLDAMERKAEQIGVPSVLAVTDAEGNLVAHRRMDDAWLPSVNISLNKAYTAAGLEMPTHELAEVTVPGESLWGLQVTDEGQIVVFGGGYPLKTDGAVVGAVGASGGQVKQDQEVATAGVRKFEELVQ